MEEEEEGAATNITKSCRVQFGPCPHVDERAWRPSGRRSPI